MVALRNAGNQPAGAITVTARSGNPLMAFPDSTSDYGDIAACSTRTNESNPLQVYVDPSMPLETPVTCTLFVNGTGYCDTLRFMVVVGQIRVNDPIPDGPRRPPLYWCYDDVDTLYTRHPAFSWVEIGGVGVSLPLGDDETRTIDLPSGFGPFVYYGQSYTQLSVCSNGFVAPGSTTNSNFTNGPLPDVNMPPMLGVHWDDMNPSGGGGGVWYSYDAANHRFIVEYDSVPHYGTATYEKFEVILYDTSGTDGNCPFLYQYLEVPDVSDITVGMQDPTATIAILCLCDGAYHRGTAPLAPGRAMLFTTDEPTTGVADEPRSGLARSRLSAFPNPFSGSVSFHLNPGTIGPSTPSAIRIYDNTGRLVRNLAQSLTWDGRDDGGRLVAPGIYFCRVTTDRTESQLKLVLSR